MRIPDVDSIEDPDPEGDCFTFDDELLIIDEFDDNEEEKGYEESESQLLIQERDLEIYWKEIEEFNAHNVSFRYPNYPPIIAARTKEDVYRFVARGGDVNQRYNHKSLLFYAAKSGNLEVIAALIEKGALINHLFRSEEHCLFGAVHGSQWGIIPILLEKYQANINVADMYDHSLLTKIIAKYPPIIDYLLDRGADIFHQGADGNDAVSMAILQDNFRMVKLLFERGAHIEHRNENGDSYLHQAVQEDTVEIASFLIARGVEINTRNKEGFCPLSYCESIPMAKLLLRNGAEPRMITTNSSDYWYEEGDTILIEWYQNYLREWKKLNKP